MLKDPIDVPPIPILDAAHFTTQDLLTHAGYCCDRRYLLSVHKNCKAFYKHEGAYFADCDSAEGASGGPIFVKRNGKYYIVAVHSASGFQFDTPDGKIKLNAMTSILHERHNLEELAKCEKEE